MIDVRLLALAKSRYTVLDSFVILAVIATALFVGLIPASGIGIALAILLFIRGQLKSSVVRRKISGAESLSRRNRTQQEMEILGAQGGQSVILELQGSLFFGTADQLYTILEPEIKSRRYIVLDMRRVQSIDITVAHWLEQVRQMMSEKNGFLVYSRLPTNLPSGQDMEKYVDQTGLAPYKSAARVFGDLDEAKGWIENRILKEAAGTLKETPAKDEEETPLSMHEIDIFKGRKQETLEALDEHLIRVKYPAGAKIYSRGDVGTELYFVRRGVVSLTIPINNSHTRRLYTIGRGSFFGESTFLHPGTHSTNATAATEVELFMLSRSSFDAFSEHHRKAALNLLEGLATVLVNRVRFLTAELMSLDS
jgi:SulP family sulfate permease